VKSLGRPSRHPIQIGMMLSLMVVAASQLVAGPAPHSINVTFADGSAQKIIALAMLAGTALCLIATILFDAWTAAGFEVAGFLLLSGVFIADGYQIITTVRLSPSTEIAGFVMGALGGLLVRGVQLSWDTYRIVKDRRPPPIIEEPPPVVEATIVGVVAAAMAEPPTAAASTIDPTLAILQEVTDAVSDQKDDDDTSNDAGQR